jgi:hypothetical protein
MVKKRFDRRFLCYAHKLDYDFEQRHGRLYLGGYPHGPAVIELFEAIDPRVVRVDTFEGERPDSAYVKEEGEWRLYRLRAPKVVGSEGRGEEGDLCR